MDFRFLPSMHRGWLEFCEPVLIFFSQPFHYNMCAAFQFLPSSTLKLLIYWKAKIEEGWMRQNWKILGKKNGRKRIGTFTSFLRSSKKRHTITPTSRRRLLLARYPIDVMEEMKLLPKSIFHDAAPHVWREVERNPEIPQCHCQLVKSSH